MDEKISLIVNSLGKEKFKLNEPVAYYSALKLGGKAKLFTVAFTESELIKVVKLCRQLKVPYFIFGSGTKMVISDQGFEGVVIQNRTRNIEVVSIKGKVSKIGIGVEQASVTIESGVSITKLIEFIDKQGLSSQEFNGIPGTVGGNIFINRLLQERTKSIKVYTQDDEIEEIDVKSISLSKHVILSVVLNIKAKQPF